MWELSTRNSVVIKWNQTIPPLPPTTRAAPEASRTQHCQSWMLLSVEELLCQLEAWTLFELEELYGFPSEVSKDVTDAAVAVQVLSLSLSKNRAAFRERFLWDAGVISRSYREMVHYFLELLRTPPPVELLLFILGNSALFWEQCSFRCWSCCRCVSVCYRIVLVNYRTFPEIPVDRAKPFLEQV